MMSSKDVGRILSARGRRSFRLCLGGVDRFVPLTGIIFDGVPDGEVIALIGDGDVSALVVDCEVVLTFLSSADVDLWI